MAPEVRKDLNMLSTNSDTMPYDNNRKMIWKNVSKTSISASNSKPGSSRILVASAWMSNFLACEIGEHNFSPGQQKNSAPQMPLGEIDNSPLLASVHDVFEKIYSKEQKRFLNLYMRYDTQDHVLRSDLEEDIDFSVITPEQWELLSSWFGGGPRIERKVIQDGRFTTLELYPLQIWICKQSKPKEEFPLLLSRFYLSSVDSLKNFVIRNLRDLTPCNNMLTASSIDLSLIINGVEFPATADNLRSLEDFACIIVKDSSEQCPKLSGLETPVFGPRRLGISSLNKVSSSVRDEDNMRNAIDDYLSVSSTLHEQWDAEESNDIGKENEAAYAHSTKSVALPLTVSRGLRNLGNTCFLNASLQCLSHTEELTDFFLGKSWRRDLNPTNPLGMRGHLAEAYHTLLRRLWLPDLVSPVCPQDFKAVLGQYAPHFAGYSQQDAQELLAFVLDGLHEDLNRVRQKPLVEMPTGDGTNDEEISQLAWQRYQARNDSAIADTFTGQYRSELVCPVTGRKSVAFDPFNCLTLQLPQSIPENRLTVFCRFRSAPGNLNVRTELALPQNATFADVRMRLAASTGIASECMVLADLFCSRFDRFHQDSDKVWVRGNRRLSDLYAFETPVPTPVPFDGAAAESHGEDGRTWVILSVLNRRQRRSYLRRTEMEAFGTPTILAVQNDTSAAIANESSVDNHSGISTVSSGSYIVSYAALWAEACSVAGRMCRPQRAPHGPRSGRVPSADVLDVRGESFWRGRIELRRVDAFLTFDAGELIEADQNGRVLFWDGETVAIDWLDDALDLVDSDVDGSCSDDDPMSLSKSDMAQVPLTLESLFTAFALPEVLSESDTWFSPFCRQHVRATKSMGIWSAPRHLVIHLKRFASASADACTSRSHSAYNILNMQDRCKLNTLVQFPLEGLDLSQHVRSAQARHEGPLLYDLYAVVNHYGGADYGHYTSFCRGRRDGRWRLFDDGFVEEVEDHQIVTEAAYLLFYRRRKESVSNWD